MISVIIPTYNRADIVRRAILSVLAQQGAEFELIIVDDGSTDETAQLVAQFVEPRTTRHELPDPQRGSSLEGRSAIHYFYQSNQGVSSARNLGIKNSRGDYIAFLDSDDEWMPGMLEAQIHFFQENPDYKICQTDEIWIRKGVRVNKMKKHEKKGGWIFEHCLPLCAISPSSVMMHRSLLDKVGFFNESYPACEDYEMWLRIASRYPVGLIHEPYLKKYGGHEDQLSHKYEAMDRFRVKALAETIASGILNLEQTKAAQTMLDEKLKILEAGAKKRGDSSILNSTNNSHLCDSKVQK